MAKVLIQQGSRSPSDQAARPRLAWGSGQGKGGLIQAMPPSASRTVASSNRDFQYAEDDARFAETCGVWYRLSPVERLPGRAQTPRTAACSAPVTEGKGSVVFLLKMPPRPARAKASKLFPVCFPPMPNRPVAGTQSPATVAKLVDQVPISGPHPRPPTSSSGPGAWAAPPGHGHHCGAESGQR